jgi:hypothetical protein
LKHANSVLPKAISSLYQGYFPYEDARGLLVETYRFSTNSKNFYTFYNPNYSYNEGGILSNFLKIKYL